MPYCDTCPCSPDKQQRWLLELRAAFHKAVPPEAWVLIIQNVANIAFQTDDSVAALMARQELVELYALVRTLPPLQDDLT